METIGPRCVSRSGVQAYSRLRRVPPAGFAQQCELRVSANGEQSGGTAPVPAGIRQCGNELAPYAEGVPEQSPRPFGPPAHPGKAHRAHQTLKAFHRMRGGVHSRDAGMSARPKPVKPFQGLNSLGAATRGAPATRRPRAVLSNASGVKACKAPSAASGVRGPVPALGSAASVHESQAAPSTRPIRRQRRNRPADQNASCSRSRRVGSAHRTATWRCQRGFWWAQPTLPARKSAARAACAARRHALRRRRYRSKPEALWSSGASRESRPRAPNAVSVSQNPRRRALPRCRNHIARPKPVKPLQGLVSLGGRYPGCAGNQRPRAVLLNASGVKARNAPSAASGVRGLVPALGTAACVREPQPHRPPDRSAAGSNIDPRTNASCRPRLVGTNPGHPRHASYCTPPWPTPKALLNKARGRRSSGAPRGH
jgi:hypothetical protein